MKTLIASIGAVAALAAAAGPAAAQGYYGHDRWDYGHDRWDHSYNSSYSVNARQGEIERQIDRGIQRGDLTRREAMGLRREFRDIAELEARYRVNGVTRWEQVDLNRRLDQLEARTRYERRDNENRWDGRWHDYSRR